MENTPAIKHAQPKGKKPVLLIVLAIVAAVLIAGACVWFFWLRGYLAASKAAPVYVTSVASIVGAGSDTDPRYSGLVEPQEITKINKDDTRTVADVMVKEGDDVQVGTPLFRYDTEEIQLSIRQAELELEGIANQIATLKDQKSTLEAEKKKAAKDEQYSYTVSIQSTEYSIKEQEYQRSVKQSEIEKLKSSQENNEVLSEVEGTVQEINLTPKTDSNGQQLPFMSILSSGEFRIKGTVTEQNINSIFEGQAVTIRSRVDADAVWEGTVETVNYEPVQGGNNNMYGGDMGEQSSKYNFYVVLSNLDGLILGQHVYIEPQKAQTTQREGLWLPAMYLASSLQNNKDATAGAVESLSSEDSPVSSSPEEELNEVGEADNVSGTVDYVWVRDENDKLEKRQVLLGEYDPGEDLYEVISGLELGDYIALPKEDLVPGGPTTTDASAQTDSNIVDGETDPGFAGGTEGGLFIPEGGEDSVVEPASGEDGAADDSAALPEDGIPTGYEDGLEPASGAEGTE